MTTKEQIEHYHKEVRDGNGNLLKVGCIVAFPDSYEHRVRVGIIHHFSNSTVILKYPYMVFKEKVVVAKRQVKANRILKIGHCNNIYQGYKEYLDDYGKALCNSYNSITQYNDLSTSEALVDEAL